MGKWTPRDLADQTGRTFVVKYGGSFMDDPNPEVRNRVAYDIAFLAAVGINVVVVHGGGKAITKAMQESGLKANFINGLRVTDEPTIQIVKKTLDEIVNRDVCAAVSLAQGKPKGLAGDSVLVCEKLTVDDDGNEVDLGFVGDVTEVKAKLIKKEIADGFIPIISPVASRVLTMLSPSPPSGRASTSILIDEYLAMKSAASPSTALISCGGFDVSTVSVTVGAANA